MTKERFSLTMIDAMSEETMRQILREQELEYMRADKQAEKERAFAEAEQRAKEENDKYLESYFQEKFANQHPKYHDQY
jgi:hypothetical protein